MLVSVIVPVYNVKKYLQKCVDSIINQDYRNIELILVDDGSTDGSGELCDLYASRDKRIVVLHKANFGSSAARNSGIKAAAGDYILFVDGDDYISPNLISAVVKKATESNADIVMFDAEFVDENGGNIEYLNAFSDKFASDFSDTRQALIGLPALWNKLYKKALFTDNKITIPEGIAIGEDLAANIKLISTSSKTAYVDKPFYYYVKHSDSVMSVAQSDRHKVLRNRDIIGAYENAVEYLKKIGKYREYTAELEYIAVYHILFTATMRVNECDPTNKLQAELVNYTLKKYPHFEKNRYYKCLLSRKDKISVWFLKHRLFRTLHFVLRLNRKLTGR